MKNIIKSLLLFLFIFNISVTSLNAAVEVRGGTSDAAVADAISKGSNETGGTLDSAKNKFQEIREKIKESEMDPNASTKDRFCTAKDSLLMSGSTIAKEISPFVYFLMTILILLAIKKLFLDNPEQEKNGLSSTVIKGSLYIFIALLLSQYNSLIDWWDDSVIPQFNEMCSGGEQNAWGIIIMGNLLLFIFIVIKLIGALIIVVGLFELVKKDRSGKVNVQAVGLKIIGGMLLINYKWVLVLFGVIEF